MCVCVCRSEEHTSELQSHLNLVCRLLLEKKKKSALYRHGYDSHLNPHIRHDAQARAVPHCHTRAVPHIVRGPTRSHSSALFFFLNDRPPPKFSLFPPPAAFRT